MIFYQFRYGSGTSIRRDGHLLAHLIYKLWENSDGIDRISAHAYLYNKYFKNNRDIVMNTNTYNT